MKNKEKKIGILLIIIALLILGYWLYSTINKDVNQVMPNNTEGVKKTEDGMNGEQEETIVPSVETATSGDIAYNSEFHLTNLGKDVLKLLSGQVDVLTTEMGKWLFYNGYPEMTEAAFSGKVTIDYKEQRITIPMVINDAEQTTIYAEYHIQSGAFSFHY